MEKVFVEEMFVILTDRGILACKKIFAAVGWSSQTSNALLTDKIDSRAAGILSLSLMDLISFFSGIFSLPPHFSSSVFYSLCISSSFVLKYPLTLFSPSETNSLFHDW